MKPGHLNRREQKKQRHAHEDLRFLCFLLFFSNADPGLTGVGPRGRFHDTTLPRRRFATGQADERFQTGLPFSFDVITPKRAVQPRKGAKVAARDSRKRRSDNRGIRGTRGRSTGSLQNSAYSAYSAVHSVCEKSPQPASKLGYYSAKHEGFACSGSVSAWVRIVASASASFCVFCAFWRLFNCRFQDHSSLIIMGCLPCGWYGSIGQ